MCFYTVRDVVRGSSHEGGLSAPDCQRVGFMPTPDVQNGTLEEGKREEQLDPIGRSHHIGRVQGLGWNSIHIIAVESCAPFKG